MRPCCCLGEASTTRAGGLAPAIRAAGASPAAPGVVVLLLFLAGCTRPTPPAATAAGEKEAPKLTTIKPEKKAVRRVVDQPAQNVEAFQQAPLYAKIAGYVKKLHVDIGARVKEGQPLVDL